MLKVTTSFALGIALLLGQFGSAGAISIISGDGNDTCSRADAVACTVALMAGVPGPFQPNNPSGPDTGRWVSYNAGTGAPVTQQTASSIVTPFATFFETFSGAGTLTVKVWADDTAEVTVTNGGLTVDLSGPGNFTQDGICADGPIGCEPDEGSNFVAILGAGDHILSVKVFQVGDYSYGTLWSGAFEPVPEPATILLLGSALTAAGVFSRRRWRQKSPSEA